MKRLMLLCVAMLAVVLLAGCGGGEEKTAEEGKVLEIGSISPLTGPYAADGNDIKNGALTAIEVVKSEGGIPGFSDITLSSQDSACDPRQAVAAANKLINEEVSGVIGAYCSSATIPASETLAEENIVMLTPASTSEKVTERGLKYMFRTCGRDDDQSKAAATFIRDFLKAGNVYIVDDKTTYSQGLADNLEKLCPEYGIEVLAHDHVNQGDKDFSAVLTKVKAANPDVFYVSLQNSATGALMLTQAKRMGIDAEILAQDAVYHPQLMEIAKDAANGVYLTFGYTDKESESYKRFLDAYKPKYGDPGAYSAYAYDSAMAYLKAVKQAGSADADKVRQALLDMTFEGASKRIDYKSNGDSGSNYVIQVVRDGEFVNFWDPQTGEKF
ncbi:branched-chain amino acid ABC transporter substrate-binding protein [Desulfovibrio oxyclinae]|uniref:branched-chain amino acid ABC transporter substrate-binding protein n=1 Tax=Desulfovibrio oxyclinae TaxID=63560 RepID=UPI00037BB4E3|nr:branched-chain amino acid ABC transporter substrate-binding protein [Desulfovibrio oxyclinae]